ncbi:MAG: SusD/RagB family nutrient-binding outer membrane lipoprotein, partial [Bacteroidota bacterium]
MKTKNIFILGLAVMFMIAATSCKKYLDVNQNQDLPSVVPPKVLLPSAEGSLAYSMGGDAQRYTSTFMQYVTGAARQFYSFNKYSFTEEDFNNLYNNMFADNLHDMNSIIVYAQDHPGQYTNYESVAKILTAYSLSQASDWWGDVPYSEAFKGFDNLHPKFDSQESIYNSCFKILNEAIDSIAAEAAVGDDLENPGDVGEDFLYGGDVDAWTAFAHGLKARLYLHLSNVDAANYQNALDELAAGGLTSGSGDAKFTFSETANSPWSQYIENRD